MPYLAGLSAIAGYLAQDDLAEAERIVRAAKEFNENH